MGPQQPFGPHLDADHQVSNLEVGVRPLVQLILAAVDAVDPAAKVEEGRKNEKANEHLLQIARLAPSWIQLHHTFALSRSHLIEWYRNAHYHIVCMNTTRKNWEKPHGFHQANVQRQRNVNMCSGDWWRQK